MLLERETLGFILNANTRTARIVEQSASVFAPNATVAAQNGFVFGPTTRGDQILLGASLRLKPGEYSVELSALSNEGEVRTTTVAVVLDPIQTVPSSSTTPPVVLLNGWQVVNGNTVVDLAACLLNFFPACLAAFSGCPISSGPGDTFGSLSDLLTHSSNAVPAVYFFDNCKEDANVPIEQLGNDLGEFLRLIKYDNGNPVPQVDVVGHSMGGLIVRSYLAGLQEDQSVSPPSDPGIRKFIEIATPNFGSFIAAQFSSVINQATGVTQSKEMIPGSSFLWDLATWNQWGDDLRGVDALAIVGDAGTYIDSTGNSPGDSDGVVSLLSGSLGFARDSSRTRILPYCHTDPVVNPVVNSVLGTMACSGHSIANVDEAPNTGQLVQSFLADTQTWTTIGSPSPADATYLSYGGLYFTLTNSTGQYVNDLTQVLLGSTALQNGGETNSIYYAELAKSSGTFQFTSTSLGTAGCGSFTLRPGTYFPLRCKYGPIVFDVTPLMASLSGRFVRSGSNITLQGTGFGQQCSTCRVVASPGNVSLAISAWSDQAITVALPTSLTGLVKLVVQAAGGSDTISIMAASSATILLSNTQLQYSYTVGGAQPPAQAIAVSNAGGGPLSWSATPNATWITTSATLSTLTVSVNANGLTAGVHQGSISITSSGASNTPQSVSVTLTVTASAQGPVITTVVNAFGGSSTIAPNTWVIVQGSALAQNSRTWTGSDFVANRMPVALDGVSVTMNGESTYLYYISPSQLNLLTPPDLGLGPLQVQVSVNGAISAPFTVQAQQYSPSFVVFDTSHVTGTHLNGSILGPTSLYPGSSTPATPNETVILYANGLGPTSSPVVSGDVVQSGSLPVLPALSIGGLPATVQYAGLASPGLYQLNVVVPTAAQTGDNVLTATYKGLTTQSGVYLAVQTVPVQVSLQSVTITPTSVTGGQTATGTVTLSGPAPTGGLDVQVSLNTQASIAIAVAAGQTSATFQINTVAVTSSTTLTITAALDGVQRTATLTVLPGASSNAFQDYELTITGTMTLAGKTMSTTITSGVPEGIPQALVDTTADISSGIIVFSYLFNPTIVGNTVTFTGTNGQGEYTNLSTGIISVITSGTLSLTATSPSVGTSVNGTLQFATAGGNFTGSFTGKIASSVYVQ
jgi:uncharacterized protein (TIGR03437 family)